MLGGFVTGEGRRARSSGTRNMLRVLVAPAGGAVVELLPTSPREKETET
jgi:hypothetical protein